MREINVAAFVTNPEATILRHAPLSNVQLRHDFDARDQRLMESKIYRINFGVECAIDSILDLHFCVARFNVNIRGARLHRVVDNRIDEFDDRRHLGVSRQPIEVEHLFAAFSFPDQRNAKARRRFLQDALGGVAAPQDHINGSGGGDVRHDARLQGAAEFVDAIEIGRVRHREVQSFFVALERQKLVTHHQVDRNLVKEFVVNRRFTFARQQFDKAQTVTTREFARGAHLGRLVIVAAAVQRRSRARVLSNLFHFISDG